MTVNITSNPGAAITWATDGDTWATAPYTWATANAIIWSLTVTEGWNSTEQQSVANDLIFVEGWNNAELKFANNTKQLFESWNSAETVTHTWQDFLGVLESWATGELVSKVFNPAPWAEKWQSLDSEYNSAAKNASEGWATSGAMAKAQTSVYNERWSNSDLLSSAMEKLLLESWTNAESASNFFTKINLETARFIELWSDLTNYHLNITTGWITADLEIQSFTQAPFAEGWATLDSNSKAFIKSVLESWINTESFSKTWNVRALINELWLTADSIREQYGLSKQEAFQTIDAYLKNANAVVSDIAFASGDLTMADFLNMNTPMGYSPFFEFVPGELEYQKALIAIILEGPLTTGRPQITEWQLTVDVPNQTDSGTLVLPAANIFVPFNVRFYAPPQVMVQLRGGSIGIPDITNITDTGFNVEIDDATDQPIAGDIVWSADGY